MMMTTCENAEITHIHTLFATKLPSSFTTMPTIVSNG